MDAGRPSDENPLRRSPRLAWEGIASPRHLHGKTLVESLTENRKTQIIEVLLRTVRHAPLMPSRLLRIPTPVLKRNEVRKGGGTLQVPKRRSGAIVSVSTEKPAASKQRTKATLPLPRLPVSLARDENVWFLSTLECSFLQHSGKQSLLSTLKYWNTPKKEMPRRMPCEQVVYTGMAARSVLLPQRLLEDEWINRSVFLKRIKSPGL